MTRESITATMSSTVALSALCWCEGRSRRRTRRNPPGAARESAGVGISRDSTEIAGRDRVAEVVRRGSGKYDLFTNGGHIPGNFRTRQREQAGQEAAVEPSAARNLGSSGAAQRAAGAGFWVDGDQSRGRAGIAGVHQVAN